MAGDQTLALIRTGYAWAPRLRGSAPAVPIRLLGRRAVLVGGPQGVRRFHDPRLRRHGAIPLPVRRVLFGARTVHGLDDAAHLERKAMFTELLTADRVAVLGRRSDRLWPLALRPGRVVLFDAAVGVVAAAVLPWAGIPLRPARGSGGPGSWPRWWTASPPPARRTGGPSPPGSSWTAGPAG